MMDRRPHWRSATRGPGVWAQKSRYIDPTTYFPTNLTRRKLFIGPEIQPVTMAHFRQSAAKQKRLRLLYRYLDWTSQHENWSLWVLGGDAVMALVYFPVAIYISVFTFHQLAYLQKMEGEYGELEGYEAMIGILKAKGAITILLAYFSSSIWFWLLLRLVNEGHLTPAQISAAFDRDEYPTHKFDQALDLSIRMYSLISFTSILRVLIFVLSYPGLYGDGILSIVVPKEEILAKPLRDEGSGRDGYQLSELVEYFWRWSFFLIVTGGISLLTFLINPDFITWLLHPHPTIHRSKSRIFDLIVFTATQPIWIAFDVTLFILSFQEYQLRCLLKTLKICTFRKCNVGEGDDSIGPHMITMKIRFPEGYKEPKLSISYYWAGRGAEKVAEFYNIVAHATKTWCLGWWYEVRFWGIRTGWEWRKKRQDGKYKGKKSSQGDATNAKKKGGKPEPEVESESLGKEDDIEMGDIEASQEMRGTGS
ncbi:hypothetical protein ABW19_dt0202285 [Dactylella cylindrospora]|nr:hypothetical protein ABW19_dt0202285 [Dactylella cylindrospora]